MIFYPTDNKLHSDSLIFRNAWDSGPNGSFDGIMVLNKIVTYWNKNTSYSVKDIIKKFIIENSDLSGLSPSKLVSYLNDSNKLRYKKGL